MFDAIRSFFYNALSSCYLRVQQSIHVQHMLIMDSPYASLVDMLDETARVDPPPCTPHTPRPISEAGSRLASPMYNEPHREHAVTTIKTGRQETLSNSHEVLGQFSFAPATQTTVVTTTTTTTTSFPPLVLKAPVHLYQLDSKLYPLAASPTPSTLKRLNFELEGRPTIFHEAEDAASTFQDVSTSQDILLSCNDLCN